MITIYYLHDAAVDTLTVKLFDGSTLIDAVPMALVEDDRADYWRGELEQTDPPMPSELDFEVYEDADPIKAAWGRAVGIVDGASVTLGEQLQPIADSISALHDFDPLTQTVAIGGAIPSAVETLQAGLARDETVDATINAGNTGWITIDDPTGNLAIEGFYDGAKLIITDVSTGDTNTRVIAAHFLSGGDAGFNPDAPFSFTPVAGDTIKIYPGVDVTHWRGKPVASTASAGFPVVTLKVGTGTGEVNVSGGKVPATLANADAATELARQTKLDTVESRLTETRAGYLDQIPNLSTFNVSAQGVAVGGFLPGALEQVQSGLASQESIDNLNDLSSSDVQTAAAAALTAYDPPTRAEATSDKDAVIAAIPSASTNATAVRTNLTTELGRIDATISSRSTLTAAQVWAYSTAASLVAAVTTIATQVLAIFGKLPTSSRLAGSENEDGSIEVEAEIGGNVTVEAFTAGAKAQLSDTIVRFTPPVWTGKAWDKPIVCGTSYLGALALPMTIENWPGMVLSEADSITFKASRTVNGVDQDHSFSIDPTGIESAGGIDTLFLELTTAQTGEVEPGKYMGDVIAAWAEAGQVVSLFPSGFVQVFRE